MQGVNLDLCHFSGRLPRLFVLGRSAEAELRDYLKREGVKQPLPVLNNSPENKYLEAFGPKNDISRVNCTI